MIVNSIDIKENTWSYFSSIINSIGLSDNFYLNTVKTSFYTEN